MNTRGTYGSNSTNGQSQTYVGSRLVHTFELKQRYDNVKTGAMQSLLNTLSREGTVSSVGNYRWEIALKDGAWVMLVYYPDWNALEVTVTDRELRGVDQMDRVRRSYDAILAKITPRLQHFGVTTVGAATYAGQQVQQPRFAARTRAIKAVFDMYTTSHRGAPYYIYAEVNGMIDRRSASSLDEANSIFFALERAPGEVYAAIFDPTDPLWPGPAADVYHETPRAPQAPQERPAIVGHSNGRGQYGSLVGLTIYHSVGDRADAVKQMAVDWTALYQSLASQVGVIIADPKSPSGFRTITQREYDANPPDPKKVTWWKSYAWPIIQEWTKFARDQLGTDWTTGGSYIAFAERWQTNWDVYENWKKKLDSLRAEAEKQGFSLATPKPADLPTTVWADAGAAIESGGRKLASGFGDVWNIVKYGAWAVLGIGAVVAISSVASNLRSGKDPAEKYVEMIRAGRRPRTPRALGAPRTPQLALPPGEGA